ncbi:ubiquitin-like-conjugating enzyme ATG10 [Mercenaria mercenaria]|uniref:ubiquitin-like-conjugating enzyme ATG10 n=1 Tax=Mercenaria mercenaria TaxID=6596 RepID=UPI00234F2AFA|nr:ubiquitin-like-conjugating enzyme ATG10 [Mercenaria mercenaria]
MNSGFINEDDCKSCMEELFRRSQNISDSWELSRFNGKTYLTKKTLQTCSFKEDDVKNLKFDDFSDGIEHAHEDDNSVVCDDKNKQVLMFEYHVIYSESYSVPVLYFNVYRQDGSLLPLVKVWELVPEYFRERLDEDKWTFLTQTEHPYIGRPFYQLHPCHTDKLMAAVSSVEQNPSGSPSNYLIGWLSSVGPVVLLNMPFEYVG